MRLRWQSPAQREARTQALAGAAKLTQQAGGNGWALKVDLTKLDMSDCRYCVLGQVSGTYYRGLCALGMEDSDTQERSQLGFTSKYGSEISFTDLDQAWRRVIRELR